MIPSTPNASGIGAFLLAVVAFILFLILANFLAGCATPETWQARLSAEPDFTSPNPVIPRAEFGIGGKF